jgi:hypothetical protein
MTEKSSRSLPASPKDAKGIRDFWSQKSFSLHRRAKDAFKTKKRQPEKQWQLFAPEEFL